jgi:nucleoid-associated protein YgaU
VTAPLCRTALAAIGALDLAALCRFTPSPDELGRGLAAPHAWLDRVGADAAVGSAAGALLWLMALWLMLGLLVTLAATLGGRPQGALAHLSRRITPALVRRLVIASTGASLVLIPAAAVAAPTGALASFGVTSQAGSAPAIPAHSAIQVSPAAAFGVRMPGTGSRPTSLASPVPTLPDETTPGPPLDPEPATGTVLVKPGDSLWRITEDQLGPSASDQQVAIGWPYWYRANRQVIGRDPNLLRPGERLTVPIREKGA